MKHGEEGNPLESELRAALRREAPGAGFTERVLRAAELEAGRERAARREAAERRARRWSWLPSFAAGRAAWAAVLCAVLLSGAVLIEREHRRQIEGEQAKERLMLALRVTGTQLHEVRLKVREVTIDAGIAQ
jgi:hypothetical protein